MFSGDYQCVERKSFAHHCARNVGEGRSFFALWVGTKLTGRSSVIADTQRVRGCRPRGRPDPPYLIPDVGRVSHKLGTLVRENEQVWVSHHKADARASEEPGDREPGFANLTDSIGGDPGAADAVTSHRALLAPWPR